MNLQLVHVWKTFPDRNEVNRGYFVMKDLNKASHELMYRVCHRSPNSKGITIEAAAHKVILAKRIAIMLAAGGFELLSCAEFPQQIKEPWRPQWYNKFCSYKEYIRRSQEGAMIGKRVKLTTTGRTGVVVRSLNNCLWVKMDDDGTEWSGGRAYWKLVRQQPLLETS